MEISRLGANFIGSKNWFVIIGCVVVEIMGHMWFWGLGIAVWVVSRMVRVVDMDSTTGGVATGIRLRTLSSTQFRSWETGLTER
jgi:hypothetical protein